MRPIITCNFSIGLRNMAGSRKEVKRDVEAKQINAIDALDNLIAP